MKKFINYSLLLTPLIPMFVSTAVFAQETEYTLLAPLPGYVENTTSAVPYLEGIFTLTIAVAGGLAVLMIIFGGIKYMSTDAFGGKNEAKETIRNALLGLLLAISAWLILNTINPNLVNFDLEIPTPEEASSGTPPPPSPQAPQGPSAPGGGYTTPYATPAQSPYGTPYATPTSVPPPPPPPPPIN